MKVVETTLPGVLIVEPAVHRDDRGFFLESYNYKRFTESGIPDVFVQDNQSRSTRGTLRGLHFQIRKPQAKLVRVLSGEILDVVVDVRVGSPTFKRWESFVLSADNFRQIFVPIGFAHGFVVRSEAADVSYKVADFYDGNDQGRLLWNDPAIGVDWGIADPALSPQDVAGLTLEQLMPRLPRWSERG